jgi:hypothetical protein
MAYNDDEYVKASMALTSAVHTLLDNEIDIDDIHEMVDDAAEDHE